MQKFTHKLGFSFELPDAWELASNKITDEFSPYALYRFNAQNKDRLFVMFRGIVPLNILDECYSYSFDILQKTNDIINQEFADLDIDGNTTQIMKIKSVNTRSNKFQLDYFFPISLREHSVGHLCLLTNFLDENSDKLLQQILASWKY